jgi:CBS domain-containing protein
MPRGRFRAETEGTMKVSDVMTVSLFTVAPDTPVEGVAARMREHGISGMPVVQDGRVVGVVSEADLMFDAQIAGDAMTAPAVTIAPSRSLADAAALMLDLGIDRLPVVSGGLLAGIVTRTDIVRAFAAGCAEVCERARPADRVVA